MSAITDLIEKYKDHIRNNGLKDEAYKWNLLSKFQGRPDLENPNLLEEFRQINYHNLIYPIGVPVIHQLAKSKTEEYRKCLAKLFNEDVALEDRIKTFMSEVNELYKTIDPDPQHSSHHDERTIGTFLTFRNPNKYVLFKSSFYRKYCSLIGELPRKKGEKYVHHLQLLKDFIETNIIPDTELIKLVQSKIPPNGYTDPSHTLLAQDLLYQTLDKMSTAPDVPDELDEEMAEPQTPTNLENSDFEVTVKIFPVLTKFLNQSINTPSELTTKGYPNDFHKLGLKVSFGKGNPARITWIALLEESQTVTDGIYPVFLYFKQHRVLILSYGLSETNDPSLSWNTYTQTISSYFKDHLNTEPDRYGNSFVFKTYNIDPTKTDFGLEANSVEHDVNQIIKEYNVVLSKRSTQTMPLKQTQPSKVLTTVVPKPFDISSLLKDLKSAHLIFSHDLVIRFLSCLATKPFVILTGLSGAGKTKLALSFAEWIVADSENQLCIAPVGADWTNREPLLGFPNMQKVNDYVPPENKVLQIILRAIGDPELPYFLILDEMNLSHVERYFADFLSSMESGKLIGLHNGKEAWNNDTIPNSIYLPRNLFIIGTVNVDETTYMFSPKVLDRASVIEFRVTADEMEQFLAFDRSRPASKINNYGASMASDFLRICLTTSHETNEEHSGQLINFFSTLKKAGAEFGYRSASEINRFLYVSSLIYPWTEDIKFDFVIMQKLLPKVHGSRRKLEPILRALASLCLTESDKALEVLKSEIDETKDKYASIIKYPLSLDKIKRMYQNLIDNSFTSYAEA